MPLMIKMINAEEQVTEVSTEVADQRSDMLDLVLDDNSSPNNFLINIPFIYFYTYDESGYVVWLMLSYFIKDLLKIFTTCSVKHFTLSFQCSSGKRSKINTAKLVNLLHSGNVL